MTKPFHLYVAENRGIAKGVLTQELGPWKRPVAYLSKELDPVASGWPMKDADKLTMGQDLVISALHT
ncbi:hypothetical protein ACQP3J_30435, partial [Escherichia coli]